MESLLNESEFEMLDQEKKREYVKRLRAIRGREDLLYFCREILGYSLIEDEVHGKLARVLMGDAKRKLILLPRGSFKSTIATIGGSLWRLIRNPDLRILVDSEILENSQKFVGKIKDHIRVGAFQEIYGDIVDSSVRETAREFTVKTRKDRTLKEPSVYATGIGTVAVGMHYDVIICDDLQSEKNVATKEQIDKVIAHYRLLLSLLEPGGELVIIGTRWHFYDLYSYILEEEAGGGWETYVEKAIREDGSLFFPKRLTKEFLREQEISQGSYVYSCFYLNEPVSKETQCFRREFFKYWGSEGDPYPLQDGKRVLLNIYILIDRAFSTKETADYTGIVVAGVSSSGNIYLLEAERKKCGLAELADRIYQFIGQYGAERVKTVNVETINYEEVDIFLREQMKKRNRYFILQRLAPDSRMSKQGRIETALQARYANGIIYHRKRMVDFEDELLRFPVGSHDDMIDAFAYLAQVMTLPGDSQYERDDLEYRPSGMFGRVGY